MSDEKRLARYYTGASGMDRDDDNGDWCRYADVQKLEADLAQADAINGTSVNRICALEGQIATLKGRIKALRKSMYSAYDTLAIASSEDSSHD